MNRSHVKMKVSVPRKDRHSLVNVLKITKARRVKVYN